ncbi:MAG: NADH-quinone oxidoreductase subunit N [Ardenticatenia bacterium]|nr:NADH-quinone oxidoreductase subunit N [Ardenticatenia bacterium]
MPHIPSILTHFSPELILVVGMLLVLTYDLWVRGREGLQANLAIITTVLALVATLVLWVTMPGSHPVFEACGPGAKAGTCRPGAFISDDFTHFFRVLGLLGTLLVLISGQTYMRGRTAFKGEFYALVLSAVLAMNLMAGANDLIVIALAIEFLSITSYILTAFLRHDGLSIEGGLKYFLYGSITSAAMLFGMSYLLGIGGSTSVPALAAIARNPELAQVQGYANIMLPALALVLAGIAFKIALVPFHQWSPDAYQAAPTPVTAFLSVGPKAAGFAVLIRLFVGSFSSLSASWLGTMGLLCLLSMVVGNVAAMTQGNVKRMMAYSSIAQAGYMLLGVVSLGGKTLMGLDSVGAVLFFILTYVFTNLGAFAVIIAVEQATGSAELGAYRGLMRRSPLLAVSLVVFFLSLVGVPPLAGFVAKFAVFGAAVTGGQVPLAVVGVLTGVVSVVYYFGVVREMFFGASEEGQPGPIRVGMGTTFVVLVALLMTLVVGLWPEPFITLANNVAHSIAPALQAAGGH